MHPDYTTGRLMRTARGGAFVSGENGDIYISPENIKTRCTRMLCS